MTEENGNLEALVQEKLDADTDFQNTLVDLSDEDKAQALADKESEVREEVFNSMLEKAKKAETDYQSQKVRAEKAEKGTAKKPVEKETPKNYSILDIRALNKVHDDDVEKVQKFAKSLGVSIAEAMKDEDLKAILDNREAKRKTAEATNTGGSRTSVSTNQDKEILSKIDKQEELSDSEVEKGAKLIVEAMKKSQ